MSDLKEWFAGASVPGVTEIVSLRDPSFGDSTAAYVMVNGIFICHQIEDVVREPATGRPAGDWAALDRWVRSWKVQGRTAIPSGRFRVGIDESPKFKRQMIYIRPVPGFDGIRAHGGRTPEHSEGCPLLGDELYRMPSGWRVKDGQSTPAVERMFEVVSEALKNGDEVWWTFKPHPNAPRPV